MTLTTLLTILLYAASILLIWQFVGYPVLMAIFALKKREIFKDYTYQPPVTILVPTFNEETVIEERIYNLFAQDYPLKKMDVIVVDSGSTDNTRQIVEKVMSENSFPLKLLAQKERKGKASAINYGKENAQYDIILVTDANTIFVPEVLKEMMPYFKDPKIGAVGGRHTLPNYGACVASSNQFYLDLEFIMRSGESFLDSACLFHGEINVWRKDIVNADERNLSEDLDMAIQIRRNGYKIEYEPKAIFYEPSPTNASDLITQKKRTSVGTISNIFKHIKYWIPPRNWYSGLIFPSHKGLAMFSPFLLLIIPVLFILIWNLDVILINLLFNLIIFIILFLLLLYLKSKLIKTIKTSGNQSFIKSSPKIIYYVLLNEYIILRAWIDFIFGKYSILWEKVESTR